jgi:hypothetical protein
MIGSASPQTMSIGTSAARCRRFEALTEGPSPSRSGATTVKRSASPGTTRRQAAARPAIPWISNGTGPEPALW